MEKRTVVNDKIYSLVSSSSSIWDPSSRNSEAYRSMGRLRLDLEARWYGRVESSISACRMEDPDQN